MYDFQEQLKLSHSYSDSEIWKLIYRSCFPGFKTMIDMRHDGMHQKIGIDRIICLTNGKILTVDEKVRTKPYQDILLEYLSVVEKQMPGWVCNPDITADYIAYAISPIGKGYLLPVLQLRQSWEKFGDQWISKFGTKKASTSKYGKLIYHTHSCAVPVNVLFKAIGSQLRFEFPCYSLD